ncbi:MAG: hypothetical protein IKI76_09440 [Selenomonadaceae bacterium]|nr:hypothetical protein [Selenomonadaceae bacterium]
MKERQSGKDELHLDFVEFVHDKRTPADIAYEQWLKERDAQGTKGNEQTEEIKC